MKTTNKRKVSKFSAGTWQETMSFVCRSIKFVKGESEVVLDKA